MLGGESYPQDISDAIKHQTFRVIAVLSRNSIAKPNPVKERTLALNISKERKIDYLIPINLDGLRPTDLDFMTSDLVFIPFYKSWFFGLSQLFQKLQQLGAPRDQRLGQHEIESWLSMKEQPSQKIETIRSNLISVIELPSLLRRYKVVPEVDVETIAPEWPVCWENENVLWSFGPPDAYSSDWLELLNQFEFLTSQNRVRREFKNVLSRILRSSMESLCLRKGLAFDADEGRVYFPNNLLPENRLHFLRFDGKKTYVKVVGERKFKTISEGNFLVETSRYHLSPDFKVFVDLLGEIAFRLRVSVFMTDIGGNALPSVKANRRRKALCKNWWNYEWLARTTAILQWLGDGNEQLTVQETDKGDLRLSFRLQEFRSGFGIDEEKILAPEEEDEAEVLEEIEDGDKDAGLTKP